MKTAFLSETTIPMHHHANSNNMLELIKQAFKTVAPFWPLKNLLAVNPLHGLEDMPIENIAELLGRPAGTVRVMLHRGLKDLQDIIQKM